MEGQFGDIRQEYREKFEKHLAAIEGKRSELETAQAANTEEKCDMLGARTAVVVLQGDLKSWKEIYEMFYPDAKVLVTPKAKGKASKAKAKASST